MSSTNHKIIMKKFFILTVLISLVALMPSRLFAADPAIAPAASSAKIDAELLAAYSVTNNSPLNFGKLIPTNISGTVVINPAGTECTVTNVMKAASHTYSAASFTISSPVDVDWTLAAIADQTLKLATNNETTLSVTSITPSISSGNTSSAKIFTVGATLTVPADKTSGIYSGSFPVTVTFN